MRCEAEQAFYSIRVPSSIHCPHTKRMCTEVCYLLMESTLQQKVIHVLFAGNPLNFISDTCPSLGLSKFFIMLRYILTGNRAHNIPAVDLTTNRCYITSQNHGYAVDATTLPPDFRPYFVNLNDGSNEGMIHTSRPIYSFQFHPEARGGPMDCIHLFDTWLESVKRYKDDQRLFAPGQEIRPSPLLKELLGSERIGVAPRKDMVNV